VAPGVDVVAPKPGGGTQLFAGTSAAAPFTSGAALLALDASPALTPAELKDAFMSTAVDWGPPGLDADSGAGRLDVYAALRRAGAALATPPAVPSHVIWQDSGDAQHDVEVADAGAPLALTLTGAEDQSFELLDANGDVVLTAVAGTPDRDWPSRQKELTLKTPAPGRYTARVRGAGGFTVDISGDLALADTTKPALTLDTVGQTLAGAAGTAFGDFPGVVVHVRQGATELRRAGAVPFLGRWTVTLDPPLPNGGYEVQAEQGDDAGNVATAGATLTLAPAPTPTPTPTPNPAATPEPIVRIEPQPKLPSVTLSVARQKLATARRKGLVVSLRCAGAKRVELRLIRGRRDVAKRTVACANARVVLKLDPRKLKGLKRASFTLAARAGDRIVTRSVTLS
jgi:hypothetical protein